jgi:hypothetical protein
LNFDLDALLAQFSSVEINFEHAETDRPTQLLKGSHLGQHPALVAESITSRKKPRRAIQLPATHCREKTERGQTPVIEFLRDSREFSMVQATKHRTKKKVMRHELGRIGCLVDMRLALGHVDWGSETSGSRFVFIGAQEEQHAFSSITGRPPQTLCADAALRGY